jgi:hypothetical protein
MPTAGCESVQFYHFRREATHYFRSSFVLTLLLLSNFRLLVYSISEIVAKNQAGGRGADYTIHLWAKCVAAAV